MTAPWTTAFEITRFSNGLLADELFRLAIGVSALAAGLYGFYRLWRKPSDTPVRDGLAALAITAWAVAWLVLHDFPRIYGRTEDLVSAYEQGRCRVTEGVVAVKHEQPRHGHSSGDRIVVDGREFVVSYFHATPAYRDTIAHGGVLRAGAYVRLCDVDGALVKVEVRGN